MVRRLFLLKFLLIVLFISIGYQNHRQFVLFLLFTAMGIGCGVILSVHSFYEFFMAAKDTSSYFAILWDWCVQNPVLATLFPAFFGYEAFLFSLLSPQLHQIAWNITTNEFNNRERYKYIQPPALTPWKTSYVNDCREFFFDPRKIDWTRYYEVKAEV
jgi:hypothetical protein